MSAVDLATNHPSSSWSTPMRKTLTALFAAIALLILPSAAYAGSDSPTPYDVTTVGIQLADGDTFQAHGHVNVRWFDTDGWEQSAGIHFDPNNSQPGGAWIGESFIPWTAFGITDGARITWVQISHHNAHFGEGGQKPVPVGPKPDPSSESRTDELVEHTTTPFCPTDEAGYGTVTETTTTYLVTEERTSTIVWDGADWVETWSDWSETDREVTDVVERTREMTDAEYEACGLPPTGAPVGLAVGAAGLLVLAGAGMAVARRRSNR